MIKFWKEDFKYVKRFNAIEPFGYLFNVRGESANYLLNHYNLKYPNIFILLFNDVDIYVGSREIHSFKNEMFHCNEYDINELYDILYPFVIEDMKNYEEYLYNSDYYKQDYRWGFIGWNVTEHILENKEEEKLNNEKK